MITWEVCAIGSGQAVVVAIGLLFAGFVKGTTGLGYSTCALPFLVSAVGLKSAIVLVPIPALAANLGLLFGAGHVAEMLSRFWVFYAATIPGIFYGTKLLVLIDQKLATQVLGLITVAYTLYGAIRPNAMLPSRWERRLQLPAGILNGLFTGLTGSQVIPLLPYMFSLKLDPDRFVQAVNIAVVTASVVLGVALVVSGLTSWHLALLSALGVFPALLGVVLGDHLRSRLPTRAFRTTALVVILLMGMSFIMDLRSFFGAPKSDPLAMQTSHSSR
jgi:uncharacterized membrane protein YfcA